MCGWQRVSEHLAESRPKLVALNQVTSPASKFTIGFVKIDDRLSGCMVGKPSVIGKVRFARDSGGAQSDPHHAEEHCRRAVFLVQLRWH